MAEQRRVIVCREKYIRALSCLNKSNNPYVLDNGGSAVEIRFNANDEHYLNFYISFAKAKSSRRR